MTTAPRFAADELENSFRFDVGRRVRFAEHHVLLRQMVDGMLADEHRQRKRGAAAATRFHDTVNALLANLIAARLNRVDPDRFVGVSFNRNDYVGTGICCDTLGRFRDHLSRHQLVECQRGFNRIDADGVGALGRVTRLRPSPRLCEMIDALAPAERKLTRPLETLIRIKSPKADGRSIPPDVESCRPLLEAVNRRLSSARIELAIPMPASVPAADTKRNGHEAQDAELKRCYAGDWTATELYRAFTGNWDSGGRLYGGWWMCLRRTLRSHLQIDGSPTVELDYASLHPRLLFARVGVSLGFDPYAMSIGDRTLSRELGKRTFNRLLNRQAKGRADQLVVRAASGDLALLPRGTSFKSYLKQLLHPLSPIHHLFGINEGVRLQKEDSELALAVIAAMDREGVTVLPVHDSFIVAEQHQEILHAAMIDAFYSRYEAMPEIACRGPTPLSARPSLTPTGFHN